MEYHRFLRDVTQRSNSLLSIKKGKNPNRRTPNDEYHFTRKFIHLTFLMTMTFDRLRQADNFEGDEKVELETLQHEYKLIKDKRKKEFLESKSGQKLDFKELFELDSWFYYKLRSDSRISLPLSIESLRKEDDEKNQITLDELLSTIRNAVAHGQIDIGSKSVGQDREMNFIYFCSEWKMKKSEDLKRPVIGKKIVALDECALGVLISAWNNFIKESDELHRSFKLLAK